MPPNNYVYRYNKNFMLEAGGMLPGFQLKYTTLGTLNSNRSNVVWVTHALTGNSNLIDWWEGLFCKNGAFDPEHYFIICTNVLGGCDGSTGPLSINPKSKSPYFSSFPHITQKDAVRAFDLLRQHLGLNTIHTLIGASLGGQQVLEWAIQQPSVFKHIIPISCNARQSSWGIAINEAQRMAIEADSSWGEQNPKAGLKGLRSARAMSINMFRTYDAFRLQDDVSEKFDNYKVSSYQRYQGDKLVNRFNAFSYWTLTKMMDSHHVGREYTGIKNALGRIRAETLIVGTQNDILFPPSEQELISTYIPHAQLKILTSVYGHDAFLVEIKELKKMIRTFLQKSSDYVFT